MNTPGDGSSVALASPAWAIMGRGSMVGITHEDMREVGATLYCSAGGTNEKYVGLRYSDNPGEAVN